MAEQHAGVSELGCILFCFRFESFNLCCDRKTVALRGPGGRRQTSAGGSVRVRDQWNCTG